MLFAMVMTICFPLLILSSIVMSIHLGQPKKIGFWWTFFFCITLSPLIGMTLALLSPLKANSSSYSEFVQTVILILVLLSLLTGISSVASAISTMNQPPVFLYWIGTGLIGLGIYGIQEIATNKIKEED